MLPFSSVEFFIILFLFILILAAGKYVLQAKYYKFLLCFLNAFFLIIVYPKPLHFLFLIVYSYAMTYMASDVFRFKKKIWGILLLLLPLLLVKADIRIESYPFEFNNLLSFAGLSYASFRIMSYYMDKAPGSKIAEFASYFNFLTFTPTLLIGPIDKYAHYLESESLGFAQMDSTHFMEGWNALVKGIVFKYVLAECIDRYWLNRYEANSKDILAMTNGMYAYYFYLFFDFAGYSYMALGAGKMMGIEVPLNFTNPFVALNPQDFWRRFHISLGTWLRDYFFTPLYMFFTRKKTLKAYPLARQNVSLVLTFLLMGCWNGFKFNFILSGFIFGLYSAMHNTYQVKCKKAGRDVFFGNLNPVVVKYLSIFIMFNLAAFALYIFSGRCPLL
jgi:membrane protein involved in D-alanine export